MKVLVIGGGGREHALVWKLRECAHTVWCAPGNGGIATEAECFAADASDLGELVALAERLKPDLTVVGPEMPLVNGLADEFAKRRWAIVGPMKRAAQLEGSKIFAKEFLRRHGIPTAKMYGAFDSALEVYFALKSVEWPAVIKADGLCAGKGVVLAPDADSASEFVERLMEKGELGAGGRRVILEEALEGEELSFIVLTDGERIAAMPPTRDHKRVFDGNQGPNTGGMGAYSSDALVPDALRERIASTIVEPTIRGLLREGIRYQGFLYFGLMLTAEGPKVLEFNCRMGDPEAQPIAARMDFDLAEVLSDVTRRALAPEKLRWKKGASACVVMASGGYPGKFESGKRIEGLEEAAKVPGVKVLHAGTKRVGNEFVTGGGRVLGVTAWGDTLEAALATAYQGAGKIHFEGAHYRKDIGATAGALARGTDDER
ncbi:MAG: phosphoribosylamine--glycine ligase [Candidatus Acidiferrales bacterium]